MLKDLLNFASNLPAKIIKKRTVSEEIDMIYSNIRINIEPMMMSVARANEKLNLKFSNIEFFKGTMMDKELKDVNTLLKKLTLLNKELLENRSKIESYMKVIPESMSTRGMTTNQALAVNFLDNLSWFIDSIGDYLVIIMEHVTKSKDSVFVPKIKQAKRLSIVDSVTILLSYNNIKNTLVDLDNVLLNSPHILEAVVGDKPDVKIVNRFIGNPIVFLRIWWVDVEINKIRKLESDREYVELLLAEWELSNTDSFNPELEAKILKAKDEISIIDKKIEKLRKV